MCLKVIGLSFPDLRLVDVDWKLCGLRTNATIGVLNLIFFHRYFPSIRPGSVEILDLTLPTVNDVELETLIDSRVNALVRQHLSTSSNSYSAGNGVRGRIAVEFFEKKIRKSGMWFGSLAGKGEEEVCWEIWTLDVTIATPRTESGMASYVLIQGIVLTTYRTRKGTKSHGEHATKGSIEDPCKCEPG